MSTPRQHLRWMSTQAVDLVADYKRGPLRRGSSGLLESPLFKEPVERYSARQLRANFFGPREWFQLARNRARRLHPTSSARRAQALTQQINKFKTDQAPVVYPLPAALDAATEKSIRQACAELWPCGPFAVEERLSEAWSFYEQGQSVEKSVLPTRVSHGGAKISLVNPHPLRLEPVSEQLLQHCSPAAVQAYKQIATSFQPYASSSASSSSTELLRIPPDFLQTFIETVRTETDVEVLVPAVLQRWRALCSGNRRPDYQTPSPVLSDRILDVCIQGSQLATASHLLRFKSVYKLQPSLTMAERLLQAFALRHVEWSAQPERLVEPEILQTSPETQTPAVASGKRYLTKRAYPYRMVPRFYFYKPLPVVLDPEPSVFYEGQLPQLDRSDSDVKRMLPDDRGRKLQALMKEKEREEQAEDQNRANLEPPALGALTQTYQLFYYLCSQNPRFYQLPMTSRMYEALVVAGALGGTQEGWERSVKAAQEAADFGLLTPSALASLDLGAQLLKKKEGEESVEALDVKASAVKKSEDASLGLGSSLLVPLLEGKVSSVKFKDIPAADTKEVEALRKAVLEKAALAFVRRYPEHVQALREHVKEQSQDHVLVAHFNSMLEHESRVTI